jgi:glutamine amidotransferase
MIAIINYGSSNLGSMLNMLKKVGANAFIASKPDKIEAATKLILPGVGAFDNSMKNLTDTGLIPVLENKVLVRKTPILGVCLGMHLFTKQSEEGEAQGLGWFDAETVKFKSNDNKLKIPHMGWNTLKINQQNKLFKRLPENSRFYFVHSYHVKCSDDKDVLAMTSYGNDFAAVINKENIYGLQFHPEKSHKFGMQILKNFLEFA